MIKKKLKIAIIGCGRVSDHYFKILNSNKIKKCQVVAVCDIKIKKTSKFKNNFDCFTFESIEKMLKNVKIDIVFLLTPLDFTMSTQKKF